MAVPRPGPRFQFGADITKVKAAFLKISALLRENQRHYDRLGRAATRALAAFGIGAGAAIRQFARFETKMAQVNSLMSTTAEEAKALEDAAREMGATTQKSAGEAADALRYLALAGREPVEAIEALPAILDLSVGGMIDLGQASDIVTDGMSALGWEASRTAEFVDLLAQAQATSNATIGQFGEAFKKALPAGVGFNQTAQTIVATLGQLANAGLKAGEGGTLFRALTKSLVDNSAALAKYNIEVYNADGSTRDLIDIVEDFEAATRGLTDAQRDELLATLQNTRAISAMQIILTGGSAALRDYRDEVTDSAGAAKRLSDIISDTLEGDFKKLTSAMSEAALVIGTETAPALRDFIRALTALITKFNKADKGAQGTIISLFGIGARFLAITALTAGVLKGLGAIAGAFLTLRRAAIAGAGGWRIFWGAAFAGLPIIVPLMVEAAIVISKNWDQVFSAIMEKIHKFTAEAKRTLARIYDLLPGGGGRAGALRASATESDRKAAIRGALSRAAAKRGGIDEFADKVAEAEKQLARRPATGAGGAPNPYNLGTGTDTGGAGAPAGHTPDAAAPVAVSGSGARGGADRRRAGGGYTKEELEQLRIDQFNEEQALKRRLEEEAAAEEERKREAEEEAAKRHQGKLTDTLAGGLKDRLARTKTGNKLISALNKAQAIRDLILSQGTHPAEAYARTSARYPFPVGPALGALHAAGILAQLAGALGSIKSYQFGGVIGHGISARDNVLIHAAEGERILTPQQNRDLTSFLHRDAAAAETSAATPVHAEITLNIDGDPLARTLAVIDAGR